MDQDRSADLTAATGADEAPFVDAVQEEIASGAVVAGRYTVRSLLGRGGMGAVFLAAQSSPARDVALKLMRPGMTSPRALRRFELEAELLGRLTHPGIAQIYEAELHEGVPFFAMEYVRGSTLDEYLRDARPALPERLRLFVSICDAVQHAHAKGVIHRDLKPSNILISVDNASGAAAPKILDFGVARVTDADVTRATMQTEVGQIIGTLPYMSPEQVAGNPGDLDTRSDVYALGVVLYELLAGELPYDLRERMIAEAARVIREEDPRRLSTFDGRYRGDLETIVGKALEKDKDRRYQSALDLAADLSRYLADEPIAARPPSTWYQLKKFSKRNKAVVAGVGAAFGALLIGLAGTTYFLFEAREQRAAALMSQRDAEDARDEALDAQREAEAAREAEALVAAENSAIADFQAGQFERVVPAVMGADMRDRVFAAVPEDRHADLEALLGGVNFTDIGLATLYGNVLRPTLAAAESECADQPKLRGALLMAASGSLQGLTLVRESVAPTEEAVRLLSESLGEHHEETLAARAMLLIALTELGEFNGLVEQAEELLAVCDRELGRSHEVSISARSVLGSALAYTGRAGDAAPVLIETSDLASASADIERANALTIAYNAGSALEATGKLEEAAPYYDRVLEGRLALLGPEHPDTIASLAKQAQLRAEAGKIAEAGDALRGLLETCERALGGRHGQMLEVLRIASDVAVLAGDLDEAAALRERAAALLEETIGLSNPITLWMLYDLGEVYTLLGRAEEAEAAYLRGVRGLELSGRDAEFDDLLVMGLIRPLASQAFMGEAYDDAERLYSMMVVPLEREFGAQSPTALQFGSLMGLIAQRRGAYDLAEQRFLRTIERMRAVLGEEHALTAHTEGMLAEARAEAAAAASGAAAP